ncbi:hypothetical protein CCUS01_10361 [Colletotrichum cuscutae]|uniref:Uncharacterized protein n=1 Tax=Colletotrichum cuscutae TaxID=1209917 RepID=A0AAI9UGF6_9PEZI|nr:hypothetical protein CCUS01_10361 [Colletotrichum cuscutae]
MRDGESGNNFLQLSFYFITGTVRPEIPFRAYTDNLVFATAGVNDVNNKDAGSTLRLDVDEIRVEEALGRSLELLWKSWLEPLLEVDEDITVDSDEDSNIEPDERSSELDEALVEDTFVVGSKVSSSAVLAVLDDMILEMLEDGPEGLLELILEGVLETDMEDTLLVDSEVLAEVDDG